MIRCEQCEIRPVVEGELESVLEVYRGCEDFLALGPQPKASMAMVLADLEESATSGGVYCGIWDKAESMIGVVDFVPQNHNGDPHEAYLSLLMIAGPHRGKGIGACVVGAIEDRLAHEFGIRTISSGVQTNNNPAISFWQKMGYKIVSGAEVLPDTTIAYALRKELP